MVVTEEPADQDSSSIAVLTAQLRQKSDKEKVSRLEQCTWLKAWMIGHVTVSGIVHIL